jgi:ribosomal protein S9
MEILARAVGRRKEGLLKFYFRGTGQFIINTKPTDYLHNNSCSLLAVKALLMFFTKMKQIQN